jgi:hypothetical protein
MKKDVAMKIFKHFTAAIVFYHNKRIGDCLKLVNLKTR